MSPARDGIFSVRERRKMADGDGVEDGGGVGSGDDLRKR